MTNHRLAEVRNYYNAKAELYQTPEQMVGLSSKMLLRLPKYLLRYTSQRRTFLDAGCGTGIYFDLLKEHFEKLYGLDLADQLLGIAKAHHPYGNFSMGTISRLMFSDEQFDLVWCRGVLMYLEEKDLPETIAEFRRVLADEGVVVLQYYSRPSLNDFSERITGIDTSMRRPVNSKQLFAICAALDLEAEFVQARGILMNGPLYTFLDRLRFVGMFILLGLAMIDRVYELFALTLLPFSPLKFFAGQVAVVIRKKKYVSA